MRLIGTVLVVAGVYFAAAKLGLRLAFVHPSATPVWPPTGIALASLLLLGYRAGPGIFLGAFLANLTTYGTVWTSLGIATGNTLEALVGTYLVNRYANGWNLFAHPRDIFKFAAFAALLSTMLSATTGVTSLALGGYARWADYRGIWLTWWLGDAAGALIFSPLLILYARNPRLHWDRPATVERATFLLTLLAVCWVAFGGLFPSAYLTVPFLVWAAFRFDLRDTAAVIVILTAVAIWATIRHLGPFVGATPNESLLLLQAFMGIMAMVALPLASVVAARKAAEQKAEGLSVELQHQNAVLERRVGERTGELEETLSLLRATLESTADGLLVVDEAGRIVSYNRKFAEMWRIPDGILAGRDDDQALHFVLSQLKDPERFLAKVRDLYEQPEAESLDVLEFTDGRVFERYSQPRRMAGRIMGRVWSFRDVTEHARSLASQTELLRRLEAAEARFRGILESAPDGMVIVDEHGAIVLVNGQLERLFGYPRDELIDKPVELLIPERFRDIHRRHRADYADTPRTRPMGAGLDLKGRRKDGSEFPLEISLSPLQTPQGVLAIAAIRDITERRQAEERDLQQMQTLNALYVSAQKLSQSLDQAELADYIVSTPVKIFGVQMAWLGRAGSDGAIHVLTHYPLGELDPAQVSIRWDDPLERLGPTGQAVRTGFPVVMDAQSAADVLSLPRAAASHGRTYQSVGAFPLTIRDRPFGLLVLCSEQADFFTPSRTELFQAFAHLAAAALENARLLSETQQRADQFAALYETARATSAQLDLPALLETILDRAMGLLRVPAGGIYLRDAARETLKLAVSRGASEPAGTLLNRGEGMVGRVAQTLEPLVIDDYQTWSGRAAQFDGMPFAASMGVPLIYQGELIGAISLEELVPSPRRFTDADVHLLTLFASHAAGAVHNARSFAAAARRMDQLQALRDVDAAISGTMDLQVALGVLLDKVTTQLHVDASDVLLFNQQTQGLEFAGGRGFRTHAPQRAQLRLGQDAAGRAALERRLISIPDLSHPPEDLHVSPVLTHEGFVACYAVPLISKGQVQGVLEIFHRGPLQPDQEWLGFLITLAGQAALAINNAMLLANLQRANTDLMLSYDVTLEGWSRALDLRDRETEGHTQRVTELAVRLARAVGAPDAELEHIRRGALLHDIGKMGIPDAILLKPGPLTDEEWVVMKRHPIVAYELLAPIAFLRPALHIPRYHHEKWDGTGYPEGLQGEGIPLAARIFAVVDVYDALTSDRPYRAAWTEAKARDYIREQVDRHFDRGVVETFLRLDLSFPPGGASRLANGSARGRQHWDRDRRMKPDEGRSGPVERS